MRKIFIYTFLFIGYFSQAQTIYLIPGQGADKRLFSNFELDSTYSIKHIEYFTPEKHTSMADYALQLANQIDTLSPFVLIGTSLGGMLAVEMNKFLNPEQTIIISSAKERAELPFRYRFQKAIPIYKLIPKRVLKSGAKILQPIVEPDRKNEKEIFKAMLSDKDPEFHKRSIEMIVNWDRETFKKDIIHIHGDNDHTLPNRHIKIDYLIENGSHMMTLTRGKEISILINNLLKSDL